MKIHARAIQLFLFLMLTSLILAGCERPLRPEATPSDSTATQPTDSGQPPAENAGTTADTTSTDAGASTDAGTTADTTSTDTGASTDAGTTAADASSSDTGAAAESGSESSAGLTESPSPRTDDSGNEASGAATEAAAGDTSTAAGEPSTTSDSGTSSETDSAAGDSAAIGTAETTTTTSTEETTGAQPAMHVVAAGENLFRIGLKYGYSWTTLAAYNGLANANAIYVGQELKLPPAETTDTNAAPESQTPDSSNETVYTIKANDNLYRIGLAYGVNWVQIAEANGILNPNQIVTGQILKIPTDAPGPTPEFTHTVQTNETLFLISLAYGVNWVQIAEANNIASPYVIFPGQELRIPSKP